jgi:hypothetical protein
MGLRCHDAEEDGLTADVSSVVKSRRELSARFSFQLVELVVLLLETWI